MCEHGLASLAGAGPHAGALAPAAVDICLTSLRVDVEIQAFVRARTGHLASLHAGHCVMATESPKGPSLPRADELVDPVRNTRSVPLSDCHPHLDLPHPQRVQIWGVKKGGRAFPPPPPWVVAASSHSLYDVKVRLCVGKKSKHTPWGFEYMPSG